MDDSIERVIVIAPAPLRARVRAALDASGLTALFVDDDVEAVGEELTARELDVLAALGEGLGNRAIASRLGISEHTVKFHLASIYGKLGATSRADAIRRAFRRGLVHL